MPQVDDEVIDMIYSLANIDTPQNALKDERTKIVVKRLLRSKGMKLPMASTVLHFYYPQVFPIIDQRAYRELYGTEYPQNINKKDVMVDVYLSYIADACRYQKENCPEIPFEKIDKVLYQIDKEKGYKVKY